MQQLHLADVDFNAASRDYLGQGPTVLRNHPGNKAKQISKLRINRQYGRFGNNFYQIMHGVAIAKLFGIHAVVMPSTMLAKSFDFDEELDMSVTVVDEVQSEELSELDGSFFAPTGFERVFGRIAHEQQDKLIRKAADLLYAFLKPRNIDRPSSLVLHFRAGDLFGPHGSNFGWYVQPPAAFYIAAVEHAMSKQKYDLVDLVYEDQTNPTLAVVEQYLRDHIIAFHSASLSLTRDIERLVSATCLIASFGTFVEAASLISDCLTSYYAFRSIVSQIDYAPFLQTTFPSVLRDRGVQVFVVKDAAVGYIAPKTWANTVQQKAIMTSYPKNNLVVVDLSESFRYG